MVAIGVEHSPHFAPHVPVDRAIVLTHAFGIAGRIVVLVRIWLHLHPVVDPQAFRLNIDTQFVGRLEGRLGWTPRVKPHLVEAVFLVDAENLPPGVHVAGGMAANRGARAIEIAVNEGRPAVDGQMLPEMPDRAKAERGRRGIAELSAGGCLELQFHLI